MNTSDIRRLILLALLAIIVAGGALRLGNLRGVPPGLWFDEALNGSDAAAVWHSGVNFQIVYPDVFPREPMYVSMLAVMTKLLGARVETLRLTSALIGLAAIVLIWAAARREWGEGPALAAAGALATMRWHAIFSRLVFRTILMPAWIAGLVWAALALRRKPTPARAVAFGLMLGGGFYTYLAWYLMAPFVAGLAIWLLWPRREEKTLLRFSALAMLVAALAAAPIAIHYTYHPEHIAARPGAVSPFAGGMGEGLREISKNVIEAAGMFHWRGDHVPKHNIPHAPALDPVQGALMLIGLALCAVRARRRDPLAFIALGWLVCGVSPTIFATTDSPNFLRTLVVTPAVALMIGLGIDGAARFVSGRWGKNFGVALAVALVAISCIWSGWDIYARWANRPDVWEGYNGAQVSLARGLSEAPEGAAIFVPQFLFEHRSFQYVAGRRLDAWKPYSDFSPLLPAPGLENSPRWIVVTANNGLYEPLASMVPSGGVGFDFKAPGGNTWALAYVISPGALPNPAQVGALAKHWRRDLRF